MYGCESWTIKKAERWWRIKAFEQWCWIRLLRVLWIARRSNQWTLKEISPKYSLEALILTEVPNLRPLDAKNWRLRKDPDAGKDWRQEKGMTEDKVVGWHHQLDGHEFEQAPGVGDGQGSLLCCHPWGCEESDMTEHLNWTEDYNFELFKQFCAFVICYETDRKRYTLFVGKVWGWQVPLMGTIQ